MGHGKPGKSWNLSIPVSRPGKSWNLIVGHEKSYKIIVCVVCKLLQASKQGQIKIQASYVRKYPKTRMMKVKSNHCSKFSNLSNWKEEA